MGNHHNVTRPGVINFADRASLGLAAVPIVRELHLSPAQYGLVSGSFFLLFALSSISVTVLSDQIGTQKVLALLATSWAIVQVVTVFVFSFPALLLTRIALGAGEGPSYGTSVSTATPWLPADRRAFGLGVVTFGSAVGPALFAPPLTYLIVGWRSAFALLGGIGLLWVILWLLVGREHPGGRKERGVWILQCVSISKPVTVDKWDRFHSINEARRRTTNREGTSFKKAGKKGSNTGKTPIFRPS